MVPASSSPVSLRELVSKKINPVRKNSVKNTQKDPKIRFRNSMGFELIDLKGGNDSCGEFCIETRDEYQI
ncbi:hypothetical protein [Flavobacterium sp. SORGH_AS_0622]|uniref:hypothetical protein n=1 Tax=Flavobacterium sp. SORGH_AS_0622 TaxID=3041772 RepID=UPI0027D8DF7C|nr:hypothetical protein [Flavobacterium sp. SORGH_AS_0622]